MSYIDVTYNFTTIAGQVVAVWADNRNPTVEVGRKVIDGTVTPKQGTFRADNLQNAVYQFRYYESSNGVALDALLMPPDYVKAGAVDFAVAIYHYVTDRGQTGGTPGAGDYWADPVEDTDTLTDERLKGATGLEVEVQVRGVESLNFPAEYEMLPTGGIRLLTMTFTGGNPVNIKHFKRVERTEAALTTAGESFLPLAANLTIAADHFGKHLFATFGGIVTATFPEFNTLAPGVFIRFSTYNLVNGQFLILQFAGGNAIHFAGAARNRIVLGASEEVTLYFYLDGPNVKAIATGGDACALAYARAGQVVNGTQVVLNTLVADANAPEYSQSNLPRLMDQLPPGMIVQPGTALGQWGYQTTKTLYDVEFIYFPYRSKFAVNNVSGTVRLPILTDFYLKFGASDAGADRFTAGVGSVQWNDNLFHGHRVATNGSLSSSAEPARSLRRVSLPPDPYNKGEQLTTPFIEKSGATRLNPDNFLNLPLIGI